MLGESDEGGSKDPLSPVLPGPGIGGLAGAPLHPLALGNVATLRRMLDADSATAPVVLLGIGGVADADGFRRMRAVGAVAVGVGTRSGVGGCGFWGDCGGFGGEVGLIMLVILRGWKLDDGGLLGGRCVRGKSSWNYLRSICCEDWCIGNTWLVVLIYLGSCPALLDLTQKDGQEIYVI